MPGYTSSKLLVRQRVGWFWSWALTWLVEEWFMLFNNVGKVQATLGKCGSQYGVCVVETFFLSIV